MAKIEITIDQIKDLVLPDGYELKTVKTKIKKIKDVEDKIKDLEKFKEPTDEEYLEWGRATHDYFMFQGEIKTLKENLKEMKT